MSDRPSPSMPWWATSLLAAGVTMVLGALALYLPPSRATVVLVLGAVVFVFVLLRNPAFWRRRLAGTCFGTAVALALTPELQGFLDLGSLGVLLLDGGSVLPFVGFFLAAGVLLAWQETLAERRPGDHKTEIHIAVGGQALLAAARRHGVNLDDYLTNLIAEVDHIDIKAVHTTSKEAMRAPIEELYTPLRSRNAPHERDPGRPPRTGPSARTTHAASCATPSASTRASCWSARPARAKRPSSTSSPACTRGTSSSRVRPARRPGARSTSAPRATSRRCCRR